MVIAVAALASAAPSYAQNDCILDNCADKRPPVSRGDEASSRPSRDRGGPRGASRPGDFDFYVLSLSWSPAFCTIGGGDEKGRDQCRSGSSLGFTVHGLWPQYDHGFPSDCRGNTNPPRAALETTDGVYPERGLARYEWRKHGTCSGLSPFSYFAAARGARDAVRIPDSLRDPHDDRHIAPADVMRAFTEANSGLKPGMIAVTCRGGALEEVRICFAKDLKSFQACPEVTRDTCRSANVDVPPVR